MDKKKFMPLAIGIVLAFIAIFMVNSQLQQREQEIQRLVREGVMTTAVRAKKDIRRGQVIKETMVEVIKGDSRKLEPDIIKNAESAIGKVAQSDILRKQFILSSMVEIPRSMQRLSQKTPKGKKAYTISIDKISAVGGQINSGDRVDIIGVMRLPMPTPSGKQTAIDAILTLFENSLVLDAITGKTLESVTLALSSEEIRIITFALEHGKVKLVLRSPLDSAQEGAFRPFTYETFMAKLYAAMGIDTSKPQVQEQKPQVEIYRGGSE